MKVYVAGPWTHKDAAKQCADILEAAGHTITKKWWEHREVSGYLDPLLSDAALTELQQQAREDIAGVLDADAFVLLNLEKSEGKAVETGVALFGAALRAHGYAAKDVLHLVLVGAPSNLFHYSPGWKVTPTVSGVLALLQ